MDTFLTNLNFASPEYLWCLGLVPLYLILLWWKNKRSALGFGVSVFTDLKKASSGTWPLLVPYLRHALIISVIILFVITLARPQISKTTREVAKNGIDIVMTLDVSESMLAEDLKPNRIEAAKAALRKFVSARKTDRIGLVVFAGAPFTQSPLTFDYKIIDYYLKHISTESIDQSGFGLNGTAIGDAILAALNRLKVAEKDGELKRTKVIILLSDGDANVGIDPKIAAYKAKEEGVKIYTIGIGKKGGAPIPVVGFGGRTGYARNPDGSLYLAKFNEAALREIADITGGRFFRVDDTTSFDAALEEINRLEKTEIKVNTKTTKQDNFLPYLLTLYFTVLLYIVTELIFKQKQ